jgi:hypothetical protein
MISESLRVHHIKCIQRVVHSCVHFCDRALYNDISLSACSPFINITYLWRILLNNINMAIFFRPCTHAGPACYMHDQWMFTCPSYEKYIHTQTYATCSALVRIMEIEINLPICLFLTVLHLLVSYIYDPYCWTTSIWPFVFYASYTRRPRMLYAWTMHVYLAKVQIYLFTNVYKIKSVIHCFLVSIFQGR